MLFKRSHRYRTRTLQKIESRCTRHAWTSSRAWLERKTHGTNRTRQGRVQRVSYRDLVPRVRSREQMSLLVARMQSHLYLAQRWSMKSLPKQLSSRDGCRYVRSLCHKSPSKRSRRHTISTPNHHHSKSNKPPRSLTLLKPRKMLTKSREPTQMREEEHRWLLMQTYQH